MVERLGDEFDFKVVAADHDLGDISPLQGVRAGEWTRVGKAAVYYVPRCSRGWFAVRDLIRSTPHDVLYLNSAFASWCSVYPLIARRIGAIPSVPAVLAPRGELSHGALQNRRTKKLAYLRLSGAISLYRDLVWQASSGLEAREIRSQMGPIADEIVVAPDLLPIVTVPKADLTMPESRASGPLRLAFVSRIDVKKNLLFLLQVLKSVRAQVDLSIVGPVSDPSYWHQCQRAIQSLPRNISASVMGPVRHEDVGAMFRSHDAFVFPTLNENFGHVIIEAMAAGTPVLISPNTPWAADSDGALEIVPLDQSEWKAAIEKWSQMSHAQLLARREAALRYARAYYADESALVSNRALFALAAERGR